MSTALYLIVIVCLILFPGHAAAAAREALIIWGLDVVPSLFPYMVFSRMLCRSLRAASVSAVPFAALLGMLGGSPSGASVMAAYADRLTPKTMHMLCALTGTISPMFFLGTVSEWTKNPELCRALLISHWAGAAFAGCCAALRQIPKHTDICQSSPSSKQAEASGILLQSIDAALQIGGCIICYSVLSGLLALTPIMLTGMGPILHALLEVSGGMHAICADTYPQQFKEILLAAVSGFSGLSIITQNRAYLTPLGIRTGDLLLYGVLRAIGASGFMMLSQNL